MDSTGRGSDSNKIVDNPEDVAVATIGSVFTKVMRKLSVSDKDHKSSSSTSPTHVFASTHNNESITRTETSNNLSASESSPSKNQTITSNIYDESPSPSGTVHAENQGSILEQSKLLPDQANSSGTDTNHNLDYSTRSTQADLKGQDIVFNDAREIVAKEGDLTLENLPIDQRILAIKKVVGILREKKYFMHIASLWDAVRDLSFEASENQDVFECLFELILELHTCCSYITLYKQEQADVFADEDYIQVTQVLMQSTTWEQVAAISTIIKSATKDFTVIYPISIELFDYLAKSIQMATEKSKIQNVPPQSFDQDYDSTKALEINNPQVILSEYLNCMICHITNNYPMLEDSSVSNTIFNICLNAFDVLLDFDNSIYRINMPAYLDDIFHLLLSVASYGFLPLSIHESVTSLICLSISFKDYKKSTCEMASRIFLSSYIQDIAQSMMRIAMKQTDDDFFFITSGSEQVYNLPNTPNTNPKAIHLLLVQGIITSITKVMYPNIYYLIDYRAAVELFLPTLLASLQNYKRIQVNEVNSKLIQCEKIYFNTYESRCNILELLKGLIDDERSSSLVPSHMGMIIDILSYITEYLSENLDKQDTADHGDEYDDEGGNQDALGITQAHKSTAYNLTRSYYSVLRSLSKSCSECSHSEMIYLKNSLASFLVSCIGNKSFPDDLAIELIKLSEGRQGFIFKSNKWYVNLGFESLFFDKSKSLPVRVKLVELVETKISRDEDGFFTEENKGIILKMVDQLSEETDLRIIDSLVKISGKFFDSGAPTEFLHILSILENEILKAKNTHSDSYSSSESKSSGFFSRPNSSLISKTSLAQPLSNRDARNNSGSERSPEQMTFSSRQPDHNTKEFLDIQKVLTAPVESQPNHTTPIATELENSSDSDNKSQPQAQPDPLAYKALACCELLVSTLQVLLSGERVSSIYKPTIPSKLINNKFLTDPDLSIKLMDTTLELATNFDIDEKVRLVLIKPLLLLRADLYSRVYTIESLEKEKYNSWRPVVRNPIFTEAINSRDQSIDHRSSQYSDILLLYEKWGVFSVKKYLGLMTEVIFRDTSYEIVETVSTGLETQLSNTYLFLSCAEEIQDLVEWLSTELDSGKFGLQVNGINKMKQSERIPLILLGYRLLTRLISYKFVINYNAKIRLVQSFQIGLSKGSHLMARPCIHALNICMLELPDVFRNQLPPILTRLVQTYSATSMSTHILEFLSALASQPQLCVNLVTSEYKTLLQIALNFIKLNKFIPDKSNKTSQSQPGVNSPEPSAGPNPAGTPNPRTATFQAKTSQVKPALPRKSLGQNDFEKTNKNIDPEVKSRLSIKTDTSVSAVDENSADDTHSSLYVVVMAYQAIDSIYLCLKPDNKLRLIDSLLQGILSSNEDKSFLNEMNEVCIDMIFRFLFLQPEEVLQSEEIIADADLGETVNHSWIQGRGVITVRAQKDGRNAQIIVQRPSCMYSRVVDLPDMALDILQDASQNRRKRNSIDVASLINADKSSANSANVEPLPNVVINQILNGQNIQIPTKNKAVHFPITLSTRKSFVEELFCIYPQYIGIERPIRIRPENSKALRTLSVMRLSPTVDTHKIGVIYVGPKQKSEREILSNTHGSAAYWAFLRGLGSVVRLSRVRGYNGGLDTSGNDLDGRFGIQWNDSISHIVFHVATLMPNENLAQTGSITQHRKKAHIGNDFVHIIFNESGGDYSFDTLISQFNFVQIIVTPGDFSISSPESFNDYDSGDLGSGSSIVSYERLYWVRTQKSPLLPPIGPAMHPKLVSLQALAGLVRIAAIRANTFVQVYSALKGPYSNEFVSNWRHRLRSLKRLKDYVAQSSTEPQQKTQAKKSQTNLSSLLTFASSGERKNVPPISSSPKELQDAAKKSSVHDTSKALGGSISKNIKKSIVDKGFFSPLFNSLHSSPVVSTQESTVVPQNDHQFEPKDPKLASITSDTGCKPYSQSPKEAARTPVPVSDSKLASLDSKTNTDSVTLAELNALMAQDKKQKPLESSMKSLPNSHVSHLVGSVDLNLHNSPVTSNPDPLSDQNQISLILQNYSIGSKFQDQYSPQTKLGKGQRLPDEGSRKSGSRKSDSNDSTIGIEQLLYSYKNDPSEMPSYNADVGSLLENPNITEVDKFCLSGVNLTKRDITAAEIVETVSSRFEIYQPISS